MEGVILSNQIRGIVFHLDLMERYALMGDSRLSSYHRQRVNKEVGAHIGTRLSIIRARKCIPEICMEARIEVPPVEEPLTSEERKTKHRAFLDAWMAWEGVVCDSYKTMLEKEKNPDLIRVWQRLIMETENELQFAEKSVRAMQ